LAAQMVNNIVNPLVAQQVEQKTTAVLLKTEHALVYGNSAVNALMFDGFIAQIQNAAWANSDYADIVIDMEGNTPNQEMLEDAAKICADHYGTLDYMLTGTGVKADLAKSMFPTQRTNQPPDREGRYGTPFKSYESEYGEIGIEGSVFVKPFGVKATAIGGAKAPAAIDAITVAAGSESASKLSVGTYYYWATMCRRGFSSAPFAVNGTTTALGQKITLTVADAKFAPGGTPDGEYMSIYRSTVNEIKTATLIARVPRHYTYDGTSCRNTATDTIYVDVNQNRDNCGEALGFTWDTNQVVGYKQLAPIMKLDLAVTGTFTPFMVLQFATPVLYAPSKCIYIKNIGRAPRG